MGARIVRPCCIRIRIRHRRCLIPFIRLIRLVHRRIRTRRRRRLIPLIRLFCLMLRKRRLICVVMSRTKTCFFKAWLIYFSFVRLGSSIPMCVALITVLDSLGYEATVVFSSMSAVCVELFAVRFGLGDIFGSELFAVRFFMLRCALFELITNPYPF